MKKGGWFFLGLSAFWIFPFFPATLVAVGVPGAIFSLLGKRRFPLPWAVAGFFWGVLSAGLLWGVSSSWQGERSFRGCLSSDSQSGRKIRWVEMTAELDASRRLPVRLGIPVTRIPRSLRAGDCLSGTVTLSSYPDAWERTHLFGSAFRPLLLEGVLSPWDRLRITHPVHAPVFLLPRFQAFDDRIRNRFLSLFRPDVASVLLAMVLSDTSHLSPGLDQEFQKSGVYHLLSVSGEHMALLAVFLSGTLFLTLRLLPYPLLRAWYARFPVSLLLGVCVVPVMGCYLLLIGSPLPALRAMEGFVLVLVARAMGFRWSWEDLLGLSVIGLSILNPQCPLSLSLDLSLSALFGVAIFLRMGKRYGGESSLPGADGVGVREAVLLGGLITMTTLPLLWLAYRQLDWIGIVSNGIIVPVAGDLLLPAGFLYALVLIVCPAGWAPATFALEKLGESVVGLVSFFSRIPYGQIALPGLSPGGFVVLLALIMGGLTVMAGGRDGAVRRTLLPMAVAVVVFSSLLFWGSGPGQPNAGMLPERSIQESSSPDRMARVRWLPEQEERNWQWVLGR